MIKKLLLLLGVIVLTVVVVSNFPKKELAQPAERETNEEVTTPFTASFEIYTLGTRRDFSATMYHNLSEDAYIDSAPPYSVVVNRASTTWQEFFDTLPSPFKITSDCLYTGTGQEFCNSQNSQLLFLLNGKDQPKVLESEIKKDDFLQIKYENI